MEVNSKRPTMRAIHVQTLNGRKYQPMEGSFIPSCTYNRVLQVKLREILLRPLLLIHCKYVLNLVNDVLENLFC
jgi:hypothetical protein